MNPAMQGLSAAAPPPSAEPEPTGADPLVSGLEAMLAARQGGSPLDPADETAILQEVLGLLTGGGPDSGGGPPPEAPMGVPV